MYLKEQRVKTKGGNMLEGLNETKKKKKPNAHISWNIYHVIKPK